MSPLDNLCNNSHCLHRIRLDPPVPVPEHQSAKGLDLSGITVADFSPELLQVLLEQVADTLQVLDLNQCEIMDSQMGGHPACPEPLLPAQVLQHVGTSSPWLLWRSCCVTPGLPSLSQEFYPAPLGE